MNLYKVQTAWAEQKSAQACLTTKRFINSQSNKKLNDLSYTMMNLAPIKTFLLSSLLSFVLAGCAMPQKIISSQEKLFNADDYKTGSFGYKKLADFGEDDRIGAANYLSNEGALEASKLVKTGQSYALGMISSETVPVFGQRKYAIEIYSLAPSGENTISAHDDRLLSHLGVGTQIDGLGHIGIGSNFYNSLPADQFFAKDGLKQLGSEHIPPMVTKGVLLDIAKFRSKDRLDASEVIDAQTIYDASQQQGVSIGKGDVVLLHTGWMSMMEENAETYIKRQPGIDISAAKYLAELGVVAIGSDTGGLEVHPSILDVPHPAPVHGLLLANYGVYLLENVVTKELASDSAYEFMFVLGQPRFRGSVQAIINPVAIR